MTATKASKPQNDLAKVQRELERARRELAAVEANLDRPLDEFFANLVAASNEISPF